MSSSHEKHPRILWYLAMVSMFISLPFGMINSLLVLYLKGPMQFSQHHQYALFSAYNAMLFTLPLIGGFAAGQFGYKKALIVATLLCFLGPITLFGSSMTSLTLGLSLFATGTGIYVPTYLVLVGKLYTRNDGRRESGYTICYVFGNIGFLLSAILASYLQRYMGFNATFMTGGFFMLIVAASFPFLLWRIEHHDGSSINANFNWSEGKKWFAMILTALITIPICYELLSYAKLANNLLLGLVVFEGVALFALAFLQKTQLNKMRLIAFILLSFLSMGFFALYMLEPSLLMVFIQTNVDRTIGDITIPTALSYGLDPLYICLFGSFFAYLWVKLRKINRDPSLPAKFTLSLFVMGFGILIYAASIWLSGFDNKINLFWPIFGYLFLTCAELLISPIGFAMVGRLAPEGMEGALMGVWQTFTGMSAAIADLLAEQTTIPKDASLSQSNHTYFDSFGKIALFAIVLGVVSWLLLPFIKRAIGQPKRAN